MNLTTAFPFEVGILKDVQILIVDNDRDSALLYSIFLKYFGANVITSNSINESLEILTWFIPHILVCEIRFLGESVCGLLNKLMAMEKNNKNHIPIIVISGSSIESIDQILEIEFAGYLLKPIDMNKLLAIIENLIQIGKNNSVDITNILALAKD